jgi:tetratricopeptide (TPR) repeat protein
MGWRIVRAMRGLSLVTLVIAALVLVPPFIVLGVSSTAQAQLDPTPDPSDDGGSADDASSDDGSVTDDDGSVAPTPPTAPPSGPAAVPRRDNPLIGQGRELIDELRFEEALQTLSAALLRAGNAREEQVAIYPLLAYTYLALGREAEAEGAYRLLLAIEPSYAPGVEVPPRFRAIFDEVRTRWEADGRPGRAPPAPITLRHRSPAQAEPGEAIELVAALDDPEQRVATLVLAYRRGSEDVFQRVSAVRVGPDYTATVPADAVAPPLVEYYFEGVDETGLPIIARGDVAAPLRVAVPEPSTSVFAQWWFWLGAAVLVGAAVTTGVLLASDGGGDAPPTPLGSFIIQIR